MQSSHKRVIQAIEAFKAGKMVILTDHPERENEGDLIIPAETITSEQMNFIIRHTSGIVCLAITPTHAKKLSLNQMVPAQQNTSFSGTPFTVSIDARNGITTGVSASDRTRTIQAVINDDATADDIVVPGHIFPLQARIGGVLERQGHTEGSIDLAQLAGFKPAAVLCELMNPDGSMMRGKELDAFAKEHDILLLSIDDIISYRLATEIVIDEGTSTSLSLDQYGEFNLTVVKEKYAALEHSYFVKDGPSLNSQPLVRIHSSCMTGDIFGSTRCDCQKQLHYSLERISEEGGILIYLNQEGRGIGLFNKIKSYALQDQGLDTVEANTALGFSSDARSYHVAAQILRQMKIESIKLITNNPHKIDDLLKFGIKQVLREPMPVFCHPHNQVYLKTKQEKMQHYFNSMDV